MTQDVIIDTNVPSSLLHYYRIHGSFSIVLNLMGIVLVVRNQKMQWGFKLYSLNLQLVQLIADAEMSLLMQPVLCFPLIAGYTNGPLWYFFGISSHVQMGIFFFLLYYQVAACVCALAAKHQNIISIGSIEIHRYIRRSFVIFYHSLALLLFSLFYFSNLTRAEIYTMITTTYPSASNLLTIPNVDVYDMNINGIMKITTTLLFFIHTISITLTLYFSIDLFRVLQSKKLMISVKNYMAHKMAITSLMAQAFLPMIVITIPMLILVFLFIIFVPNSQFFSNAMMVVYSTHSSLATLTMILSTPYYRREIRTGFRRPHSVSATVVSSHQPRRSTSKQLAPYRISSRS